MKETDGQNESTTALFSIAAFRRAPTFVSRSTGKDHETKNRQRKASLSSDGSIPARRAIYRHGACPHHTHCRDSLCDIGADRRKTNNFKRQCYLHELHVKNTASVSLLSGGRERSHGMRGRQSPERCRGYLPHNGHMALRMDIPDRSGRRGRHHVPGHDPGTGRSAILRRVQG